MKYLILDNNNVVFHISDTIGYQENGNPLVDNDTLAIAAILVKEVVEHDEIATPIPEDWVSGKYVYSEGQFVVNPDYVEPVPARDLEAEVEELQKVVEELRAQIASMEMEAKVDEDEEAE